MNIHEYQAKELLRRHGVPVLRGKAVFSAADAGAVAYNDFVQKGVNVLVVKAQIHAGGRGKGTVENPTTGAPIELFGKQLRGVTVITEGNLADRAYQVADGLLNNKLVTIQTGPEGKIVRRVFIEEGCDIGHEYYCSILLDRQTSQNIVMVSTEGGVDIEEVAEHSPEKIIKEWIDPLTGFRGFQARRLAFGLGLSGAAFKSFVAFIQKLYTAYEALDCSMLEVNPLVVTKGGDFIALDAKINIDDNALDRHPDIAELRDTSEEDPLEVEAGKYNLNYIKLDGNVGCMVNGAGLAMGTMDIIQLAGGKPANFLDVGGGANVERIANAFRIMMSDPHVEAVLINIFGGIVRCDRVANGILAALEQVKVDVPVIVRLDGTNAEEAREILRKSGLDFLVAATLQDAADKVTVALSRSKQPVA
ncbi:MAG TPA: ADP-forming succinate--CoA ligase subunit beta [Bacteroidetes bacterium]|nr:ADP-forming succinate--CoA ligase subunit beta [Bacteroidota bacterium]HRK04348.1 ADP-forming succinate--CoA ligase subunit beta [Chlorobiota bacterium]